MTCPWGLHYGFSKAERDAEEADERALVQALREAGFEAMGEREFSSDARHFPRQEHVRGGGGR